MRIISLTECADWIMAHGFSFHYPCGSSEGSIELPTSAFRRAFSIPEDDWRRTLLSLQLVNWLDRNEALLWIYSWALYQPEEMIYFTAWRKAKGETRALIDAPGYVVQLDNAEDAWFMSHLIRVMMTFNWEGFLLPSQSKNVIWLADEIIDVFADNPEQDAGILNIIDNLRLEETV